MSGVRCSKPMVRRLGERQYQGAGQSSERPSSSTARLKADRSSEAESSRSRETGEAAAGSFSGSPAAAIAAGPVGGDGGGEGFLGPLHISFLWNYENGDQGLELGREGRGAGGVGRRVGLFVVGIERIK